jgi:hypothetical protein
MSAPPRRAPTVSQEKLIAAFASENARLRARIAQLESAPRVALKLAAHRFNIHPERLRRWCCRPLGSLE